MSTTTLRIDTPLRQRILDLAQATGQSAHSFMIEALAQKTEEAEWQLAMQKEAAERSEQMEATQSGLDWHDVKAWMLARASGQTAERPQVKSFDEINAAQTKAMSAT
jgi:predicted transcriptional regulator